MYAGQKATYKVSVAAVNGAGQGEWIGTSVAAAVVNTVISTVILTEGLGEFTLPHIQMHSVPIISTDTEKKLYHMMQ